MTRMSGCRTSDSEFCVHLHLCLSRPKFWARYRSSVTSCIPWMGKRHLSSQLHSSKGNFNPSTLRDFIPIECKAAWYSQAKGVATCGLHYLTNSQIRMSNRTRSLNKFRKWWTTLRAALCLPHNVHCSWCLKEIRLETPPRPWAGPLLMLRFVERAIMLAPWILRLSSISFIVFQIFLPSSVRNLLSEYHDGPAMPLSYKLTALAHLISREIYPGTESAPMEEHYEWPLEWSAPPSSNTILCCRVSVD